MRRLPEADHIAYSAANPSRRAGFAWQRNGENPVFGYLKATPLLIFVLAAYFIVTLAGPGALDKTVLSATLPSGANGVVRTADLIIAFGLFVLFFELIKATRSTVAAIVDQLFSMLLFAATVVLFLLVRPAGTSTFLLIVVMSLVDVLAGFVITVSSSRRDISIDRGL